MWGNGWSSEIAAVAAGGIELAGIAVIVIGAVVATGSTLRSIARRAVEAEILFKRYRVGLGRSILLGLEFLIAADVIRTVAVEPSWENLAFLGGLTLIRAVLGILLEVEMEGRWPWKRG
jgi:uncharacterized membrane protein